MGKYSINNNIVESVARNGTRVSLRASSALYLNEKFMEITDAQELPFPTHGIVRKLETVKEGQGNPSYVNFGLPVDLATSGGFVLLYLEIDGITETYENYITKDPKNKINQQEFISSLVVVYVRDQELKRLPRNAEVVFVDYQDPTDIDSIFFNGLPGTQAVLDPNTSAYREKPNTGARRNFSSGAG